MRSALKRIRLILLVFWVVLSIGFSITMIFLRYQSMQSQVENSFIAASLNVIKTAGFNLKVGDLNALYPSLNAFQQLTSGFVWVNDATGELLTLLPPETLEVGPKCRETARKQEISYNGEVVGALWHCTKPEPFQLAAVDGAIAAVFILLFGIVAITIYRLLRFALDDTKAMINILEKVVPEKPDASIFSTNLKFSENNQVIQKIGLLISRVVTATKEADTLKANRRLVELASNLSHDIRSPVSALRAVICKLDDVPPEYRQLIERATSRITEIADLMLDKARSGHTNDFLNVESTEMSAVISEIIAEKKMEFQTRNIALNFDSPGSPLSTTVPRLEIQRILSNLINNSVESFKDESPKIWIKAFRFSSTNARVSITDVGAGIPADVQNNLFNEGYSFGKDKGNGIGLFSAKQTLTKYGGRISLKSTCDQT